jgi:hypothetical protein
MSDGEMMAAECCIYDMTGNRDAEPKSKFCPILLHLQTHFVKLKIKLVLPTYLLDTLRGQ